MSRNIFDIIVVVIKMPFYEWVQEEMGLINGRNAVSIKKSILTKITILCMRNYINTNYIQTESTKLSFLNKSLLLTIPICPCQPFHDFSDVTIAGVPRRGFP